MKLKGSISLTRQKACLNFSAEQISKGDPLCSICNISQMMGKALPKYSKHSIHNSFLFVSLHLMLCAGGSGQSESPVAVMRVDWGRTCACVNCAQYPVSRAIVFNQIKIML